MNPNRMSLERTSDTELVFSRSFPVPSAILFEAWTNPEHVKRWWAPTSRGVSVVECDADVRPGGAYRYVLVGGKAGRFAFFGTYEEVTRSTRLVYTQSYEPIPNAEAVVTVTFEEKDGTTTLVAHEVYPSKQALDGAIASGMEHGMRETLDQLEALTLALR